jgi:RNA polymerase sigma factor (sigma-70 family)
MTSGTEGRGPGPADAPADRTGIPPDPELWGRYVARGDRDAFAALVARHSPMVLGVCRRLLGNHHDAEDAFQATFLILARKAHSVSRPELLGPWLYRVAYRTALEARARSGRRREGPMTDDVPAPELPERFEPEVRAVLDEELSRLPEKYRAPLVLCYLEGKTTQDAARALGCPRGTVLSRMARGRDRLRRRLERRGLDSAGPALAAGQHRGAASAAEVPPDLAAAAGRAAHGGGAAPAPARSLADDVLRGMARQRLVRGSVIGLVVLFATGVGFFVYRAAARGPAAAPAVARAEDRPPDPAPAGGAAVAPVAVARDEDLLQGRWNFRSMRVNGADVDLRTMPFEYLIFRDDKFRYGKGDRLFSQQTFRLVPGGGLKGMDMIYPFPDGDVTFKAIYSLDGDTLTLCLPAPGKDKPRPTAFASPPGVDRVLYVCQRQRP